jgi:hypothetical protein
MNTDVMQAPQLSTSRLLLLGASSVILCMSFIMAVFAPFPLALAVVMYGRVKGYLTIAAGLVLSFGVAGTIYGDLTLFGFYACVAVFAAAIAEIARRGISPVKGLVAVGLGFVLAVAGAFTVLMSSLKTTPTAFIVQQIEKSADKIAEQKKVVELSGDKDAIQVLQLLDRPDLLAAEMIESFPSYFFMGVFLMLWFNMFLVLKSRRLLFSGSDFPFSERELLTFRVPFAFVAVLALGLAGAVWGDRLAGLPLEALGLTIVKCLGVFYFFQGFGVLSDLLNFAGVVGFFRTLIVIVTVFLGSYLIAVGGLFDNWFDFRKYFVKRNFED